jgi:hypothetical protein
MRQKDIITRCKPPVFVQSFVIIPQHLLRWPASSYSDAEAYPEHDQDTVSLQSPWSPDYPSANVSPQSSQYPSVPWPVSPRGDPVTAASSIPAQQYHRSPFGQPFTPRREYASRMEEEISSHRNGSATNGRSFSSVSRSRWRAS